MLNQQNFRRMGFTKPIASGLLTGIPLAVVAAWLILGNLACSAWDYIWTYYIKFNTEVFMCQPGKKGTVSATLYWGDDKTLEAKAWTVESRPEVIAAASCSPGEASEDTTISIECSSDPSLFGAAEMWTTSPGRTTQLGIKASFVDPVWKSVSQGQEAVIARRAYLPLFGGLATLGVNIIDKSLPGRKFHVFALSPFEGWKYTYDAYMTYQVGDKTPPEIKTISFGEKEIKAETYQFIEYPTEQGWHDNLVVFRLKQTDPTGKLVRTQEKSFQAWQSY